MGARLNRAQWRTIVLASLGGALEFYDFIVYGIFAPSIAAAFFPASDPAVGLVLSYAIFAGGYPGPAARRPSCSGRSATASGGAACSFSRSPPSRPRRC